MCFAKKPPPPPKVYTDPALQVQQLDARDDEAALRAEAKDRRIEERMSQLSGRMGRGATLTGGRGGMGYATPAARSLFAGMN